MLYSLTPHRRKPSNSDSHTISKRSTQVNIDRRKRNFPSINIYAYTHTHIFTGIYITFTLTHPHICRHLFSRTFLQTPYKLSLTLLRTPFLFHLIVAIAAIKLYSNLFDDVVLFFVLGMRKNILFFLSFAAGRHITFSFF